MLELKNVSFSYSPRSNDSTTWALQNVNMTVSENEFVGIAGPTGSGKSTLAQIMCGLTRPQQGRVILGEHDLSAKSSASATRGIIRMSFQYPERQLFGATVIEDVAFGPKNQGATAAEASKSAHAALLQVGIDPEELGQTSPFHLSGGQQRKVALAGILAMKPKILVLDEPSAGLDPAAHNDLLQLIRTLHKRDNISVVMISHFMDDLAESCDRIIVLNQGSVFTHGTPAQVFADSSSLEAIGLTVPYTRSFADKMKKAGMTLPSNESILGIESLADAISAFLNRTTLA